MTGKNQNCETYLRLVRAASLLVPKELRSGWRREWEAEVISRWQLLDRWERLNARTRLDLFKRLQGAWLDALWFQQRRTRLVLVTLNMLVAALTAFGAVQEFIVRVILDYKTQPFLLSLAGIVVSVLFLVSGIAMLRQWRAARQLTIATGILSIALHVYGALPPHRNMGYGALLVGAGYGLRLCGPATASQRGIHSFDYRCRIRIGAFDRDAELKGKQGPAGDWLAEDFGVR